MTDNDRPVFPAGSLKRFQNVLAETAAGTLDTEGLSSALEQVVDDFESVEDIAQREIVERIRDDERREELRSRAVPFSSGDDSDVDTFDSEESDDDTDDVDDTTFGTSPPTLLINDFDDPPIGAMDSDDSASNDDSSAADTPAEPDDDTDPEPESDSGVTEPDPDPGQALVYPDDVPETSSGPSIPAIEVPRLNVPDAEDVAGPDEPLATTETGSTSDEVDKYRSPDAEVPWRLPTVPSVPAPPDVSKLEPAVAADDKDEKLEKALDKPSKEGPSVRDRIRSFAGKDHSFAKTIAGIIGALVVIWVATSHLGLSEQNTKKPIPAATVPTVEPTLDVPDEKKEPRLLRPTGFGDPSKQHRCAPPRSTDVRMAFTNEQRDAWVCRRAMGITHAKFEVDFDRPMVITDIRVVPGWDYLEANGLDHWNEQRIVVKMFWRFGQSQPIPQTFDPTIRTGSTLHIPNIATQKIVGTVVEDVSPPVSGGNDAAPTGIGANVNVDDYFAIGKIEIYGYPAGT